MASRNPSGSASSEAQRFAQRPTAATPPETVLRLTLTPVAAWTAVAAFGSIEEEGRKPMGWGSSSPRIFRASSALTVRCAGLSASASPFPSGALTEKKTGTAAGVAPLTTSATARRAIEPRAPSMQRPRRFWGNPATVIHSARRFPGWLARGVHLQRMRAASASASSAVRNIAHAPKVFGSVAGAASAWTAAVTAAAAAVVVFLRRVVRRLAVGVVVLLSCWLLVLGIMPDSCLGDGRKAPGRLFGLRPEGPLTAWQRTGRKSTRYNAEYQRPAER